ncbi:hypothetical protein [uncultured Gimesia sp.]|uniref:hypothetical protein n=1 Tax=uncultured Gimesia sp. TaxID=1678688 RepID=UPI0030D6F07E|tara:strand:+ start:81665 stop:82285 length:621 start_codon:yes stop_codon:yes gene_type:complete
MLLYKIFQNFIGLVTVVLVINVTTIANAEERHLTVSVSGEMLKTDGATIPAGSKGKLIAQLFDAPGGGDPIWTEVTHDEIRFPANNSHAIVLILGKKTELINPATNVPIKLKDTKWLLLTLQVEDKTYTTPRLALNVAGYAHQATEAYKAAADGELKKIINNYEMRIKKLEDTLAAREAELANLMKGFRKLREEVNGTPPKNPVEM